MWCSTRLWQNCIWILNESMTSECAKIFIVRCPNSKLRDWVRLYRNHNRIQFNDCKTVDEALQVAVEHGYIFPTYKTLNLVFYLSVDIRRSKAKKPCIMMIAQKIELIWDILEWDQEIWPLLSFIMQKWKMGNGDSSKHYKRFWSLWQPFKMVMPITILGGSNNPQIHWSIK